MVSLLHQYTQLQGRAGLVSTVLPDDGQGERGGLYDRGRLHGRSYVGHDKGSVKCYITFLPWEFGRHPPPRNANNVEPYTFVMLFPGKADTPPLRRKLSFLQTSFMLHVINRDTCIVFQCDVAVTEAGQFLLQVGRKATDCKTSEDTTNLIHSLELYRTQFAREQGEKLSEMSRIAISVFGEK